MARLPVMYDPRGDGCLRPASKAAAQAFAELPQRDRLFIDRPKKPRNSKAHGMYWALCQYIANALNDGPAGVGHVTSERVSDRIKIATGHCEMVKLSRVDAARWETSVAVLPRSVSFSKMDDAAFSKFLTAAVQFIAFDLCPYLADGPDKAEVIAILTNAKVQWPAKKDAA